ncbi:MAG: hypothetical protein M3Y37_10005 [Chloroflexota bacterium]|nr:hypothetical protein [Chloroflexota bacterium]
MLLAPSVAAAQADQVLVGASGILGVQFDTWAVGEIEEIEEGQALRLSRLHFDPCTGVVLHNTGASTLIYAESHGVQYAYQGGESYPRDVLAQGEWITAAPLDYLTIINPMVDPAYSVDLLILSVTEEDSFVEVPAIENFEFPGESGCDGINEDGEVIPTILAEGIAGEDAEELYLGSVVFNPGTTTEGWDILDEGTTFNMLILAGAMGTAGPNSGRGAWIGAGGVISSYFNEGPIVTIPFVNDGETPVMGLVFGTLDGSAVWLPAG